MIAPVAPVVVAAAPAFESAAVEAIVVEAPQQVAAAPAPVPVQEIQPVVAAVEAPAEVAAAAPQILKNDSIESFTMESIAPIATVAAVVAAPIAEAIVEVEANTEVKPAPVVATPAPVASTPAPARPPISNTGSLFFTADADTPSSVTRHLFEPMPTPVEPVVEDEDAQELPLLAATEKKIQDNEHSA